MSEDRSSLLERARAGDQDALRLLVVDHSASLHAYVRLQMGTALGHRETVEDLVQSCLADALGNLDGFEIRTDAELRRWLFETALHKVLKKARYHGAAKRSADREEVGDQIRDVLESCYAACITPSRHASAREELERFEQAFVILTDEQREAVALVRIVGLPYPEVAARMDRSVAAVRNLVHRGLARLSVHLGEGGPDR